MITSDSFFLLNIFFLRLSSPLDFCSRLQSSLALRQALRKDTVTKNKGNVLVVYD